MSEPQIAWAEAFTAVRVIKESIRQCANNGPLVMLEVLGNYINEVDATEDDDIAAFQAAVKRIQADHKDTTEPHEY